MIYQLDGANLASGQGVILWVEAVGPSEAELAASGMGFSVASVAAVPAVGPRAPDSSRDLAELRDLSRHARVIATSRFIRAPILTIDWGIVFSVLLRIFLLIMIYLFLIATGLLVLLANGLR